MSGHRRRGASAGGHDRAGLLDELGRTPFRPAWWARSGLVQTLLASRRPAVGPGLRCEVWPTPDGDELRLHFADPAQAAAPTLLLLHGLEGSRESGYVVETAGLARALGWRLAVLEFRSCGGVMNRALRTYHSGETGDLAFVAARLASRHAGSPLLAIGFSLGGNVLLKWLGESPPQVPANLCAAAAVSAPFDLEVAARRCDSRHGGAIARHFLRTLIPKAIAKERQFPGCIDAVAVRRCRSFAAFDDLVTAPLHGFRDASDYWRRSSCAQFLPAVCVPTVLIAAADDPLVPGSVLPHDAVAASSVLVPQFTPHGGHVGFVAGGWPWRTRRWAESQALRFLARHVAPGEPAEAATR
ncbi:MAG TPA: alpha/beta fold hydrolase [Planctomycetota bacterium]|nr:alpha/beta fold hydrolase [Planctomycetota bacterium]